MDPMHGVNTKIYSYGFSRLDTDHWMVIPLAVCR